MNKSREFDNVLDECLERLLVRGETIEQCLQSYPEQAAELKPLLQTAVAVKKASAIQPRAEFRAKARYQFHSALQAMERKKRLPFFGWLPQWATVVAIVLVVLLAGSGTVAASTNSMPDNPLYSVKLATEQVQLILTPSDIGKAKLCVKLADRRVAEIIYMANKGNTQQVEVITQRLDNHLVILASSALAPEVGGVQKVLAPLPEAMPSEETRDSRDVLVEANSRAELRMTVERHAVDHPAALQAALEKSPESVKPAIRRAIAVSEAGYEKALEALD